MKNAVDKILEINGIIKSLDPALQERASEVLLRLAFGDSSQGKNGLGPNRSNNTGRPNSRVADAAVVANRPDFFEGHDHDRLKDNVHLIVAWLYSRYGRIPVETRLVRDAADRVGLLIPNRPDNTMRQAKCKGQTLYEHVGRSWQLTDLGERYIQQRYKVKCGKSVFDEDFLFGEDLDFCQPNEPEMATAR